MNSIKYRNGVAMIISLSILLVLSMALMKTFENRSIEVAHLSNDIHRFQAESLARSLFRATLTSIKQEGLIAVQKGIDQLPAGIPIAFESGYFSNITVKPIDYRFNLNKTFTPETPDYTTTFFNILQKIRSTSADDDNTYFDLTEYDIYSVLSALNDWRDPHDTPDQSYQDGMELYPLVEPSFEVKNSSFDHLSELKLIPRFKNLEISTSDLNSNFRVKGGEEFIDINLATQDEISGFLERYANMEDYHTVYENRQEIAEIAKQDMPTGTDPKYSLTVNPDHHSSAWRQDLESLGIYSQLTSNEKNLFKTQTNHLEISFVVSEGNINLKLVSFVKLTYGTSQQDQIEQFEILSFDYI